MSTNIRMQIDHQVGRIIFAKEPLNIFSISDLELMCSYIEFLNNDSRIKIITFQTDLKHFSSGMDINDHTQDKITHLLEAFTRLAKMILTCKYPTISFIKGACLGGGMELCLLSTFVLATDDAKFGQPEIQLAHIAPIAINLLPELIGTKKATEMILTGEALTAKQALALNLINKIYPLEDFETCCECYINKIKKLSQAAIVANLKAINQIKLEKIISNQDEINKIYLEDLISHPDSLEGVLAFKEKRSPFWIQ